MPFMSGNQITLSDVIRQHPERPLLIHPRAAFTPSSLCDAVRETRDAYPRLAAASVALQFPDSVDMLLQLIALDGYAREVLLLPPHLSDPALADLLRSTGVSCLLNENGLSVLAPETAGVVLGEGFPGVPPERIAEGIRKQVAFADKKAEDAPPLPEELAQAAEGAVGAPPRQDEPGKDEGPDDEPDDQAE